MNGYKTYLTVAVGVLFSVARLFGIDFGLDETAFVQALDTLILVALAFLRRGIKTIPAP